MVCRFVGWRFSFTKPALQTTPAEPSGIQAGIKDAEKKTDGQISSIDFEMAVVVERNKEGKADIKVLSYGQDVKEGTTHKVKFRWEPTEYLTSAARH
ncbi:hypothetical protein HZB89_01355 [archaeon]|nr:hypothetical protein [archaeon]